ncbi:hypothetical protein G6514_010427 [Epicoccum nigrum]|nr:hypothetical protein G6514_010427 [Epicoccum nigrum]
MNTEDDVHFPTLKVEQTIDFATSAKLHKRGTKEDIAAARDSILNRLGIGHTKSTMVGNEAIRGVSGGERKRVSLAEVMATQAPVQCWDNSTRGLDASNAFDFGRLLRKAADEEQKTVAATLYQAGNGVYEQFDKILVLAEGRQIYYGPTSEAKLYFEEMGFICPPGANIGDFVTSVAVHTERKIKPGYETAVPDTAEDFEECFRASPYHNRMLQERGARPASSLGSEVQSLAHTRNNEKNRSFDFLSRETSPYQISFFRQVLSCTLRQIQVQWGDRWSNALQVASTLIMALTTGSLFYNLPKDSTSIFPRPGAIFFPILFFAMNKMSETTASFMGRRIVSRHKRLAYSRPSAFAIACTLTDIPLVIFTFTLFQLIYFFMTGQQMDGGKFFTSWILLILCVLSFASLYRMIGAWCRHFGFASQLSGWITMVYLLYGGYLIPVPTMHPWFRWITYVNPATYTFEALMANEMSGLILDCVEPQLIPYGPSYLDNNYRGCAVKGTMPGATTIVGSDFVSSQYLAHASHIGRNAGIVVAFWILFAMMAAIGFEINLHSESGSKILFIRKSDCRDTSKIEDLEKADSKATNAGLGQLKLSKTLFTFQDINYFVQHEGKELQLLNKVSGYVKPGQLVALMGSSGAGKTTLMDVLAQRKDSGRIEGSILVNGMPQSITFQRTTGYCEQNDIHEPTATVWESLVFAASLRQSYQTSMEEKLEYVIAIMDLLELTPLRDAIVGAPGSGLSIEQRKRLTLATELVAKPTLLFLDEPTSGLDGQSAHEICRFMRKLASFGQAIICTIHQPSATLFDAFDVLLLLARGGRTTYFGPTGQYSATVLEYFARNGLPCPTNSNPAEHVVDVVQGRFGTEIDWPQIWLDSPERARAILEIDELNADTDGDVDNTNVSLDNEASFGTPLWYQTKLVTRRQMIALWRNPDYIWNKIGLHITNGLFGGFTFWMLGDGTFDLQLHLMAVLNFIFVAPGCINQMQPLFIQNRDIFETREKKSKTYHWAAFVAGQVVSEIPALIVCGTFAFVTWYFTAGFPVQASLSGQVYFQMLSEYALLH